MTITAAISHSYNLTLIRSCHSTLLDSASTRLLCVSAADGITPQLVVAHGLDIEFVAVDMSDWSSDGPLFDELMKSTNETRMYDMIFGRVLLNEERLERVVFSNVLHSSSVVMVKRHQMGVESMKPNLEIVTKLFNKEVLVSIGILFALLIAAKLFGKRFLGKPERSLKMLKMTKILMATLTLLFYQAIISQYFLIQEPPNILQITQNALSLCSEGSAQLYLPTYSSVSERLFSATDSMSLMVQSANDRGNVHVDADIGRVLQKVAESDDIFVGSYDNLLNLARNLLNENDYCLKFDIFPLTTVDPFMTGFAFTPHIDMGFMQQLNYQIEERRTTMTEIRQMENNFTLTCAQHFAPSLVASVHFQPINMPLVSGVFWLLAVMCTVAMGSLIVEIFMGNKDDKILEKFKIDENEKRIMNNLLEELLSDIRSRSQLNTVMTRFSEFVTEMK